MKIVGCNVVPVGMVLGIKLGGEDFGISVSTFGRLVVGSGGVGGDCGLEDNRVHPGCCLGNEPHLELPNGYDGGVF